MKFFLVILAFAISFDALAASSLELDLKPNDPVAASAIKIKGIRHQIHLSNDVLSVATTWHLSDINISAPSKLLFGSIYKSKKVVSVYVDGRTATFTSDSSGVLNVDISAWPHELEIRYELLNAKTDALLEISSREFFALLPYIASNSGYGFDIRPTSSLNFSDLIITKAEVTGANDLIVFGSAPATIRSDSVQIEARAAGRFVFGLANPRVYRKTYFSSAGTRFLVLSPTGILGFDPKVFKKVISKSWPIYRALFPNPSDWIVFHDDPSLPVGAGPTGSNVFGFGYQQSVPPEVQNFLLDQAGWPKFRTSEEYMKYLIPSSPDPIGDYWKTIINHELGHLFFGFGLTTERHPLPHNYWMSLGLGLAVDELITTRMTGRPAEFYDGLIAYWKEKLSTLPIDQKLEMPDIAADRLYQVSSFNRLQHFAHGKSLYFWRRVRSGIGDIRFIQLVRDFVKRGGHSLGYRSFRPTLLKAMLSA